MGCKLSPNCCNSEVNIVHFLVKFVSPLLNLFQAVPDGVVTDLDQLSGLVLVDEEKSPAVIRRFSEESLPVSVADRLGVLFSARERWTLDQISPFVQPLTTLKLNVNALLTKYARPLNINGVKYFCAKHGK